MMSFNEIKKLLAEKFGAEVVVKEVAEGLQPQLVIKTELIANVCRELLENPSTYFDFLSCITGIDNGPQAGTMQVVYNLYSIPYNQHLTLKVEFARNKEGEPLPVVPSVTSIWKTANWHERETYDFFGIVFEGHPDLRRILLPGDWQGYPLRKDYQQQDYYHGIKVEY